MLKEIFGIDSINPAYIVVFLPLLLCILGRREEEEEEEDEEER